MEIDTAPPVADVPQTAPLNDAQVRNNAGGFVYEIDDLARMRRFVILGGDGEPGWLHAAQGVLLQCLLLRRRRD